MNTSHNFETAHGIAHVVGSIRQKGVKLWVENGTLRYKAPKGAITREEMEGLRVAGGQIVAFLQGSAAQQINEPTLGRRQSSAPVPLTFTQQSHWHGNRLSEQTSIRSLTSTTCLRGRLNVKLLRESLTEIVDRHEALRTRIVVCDGVPMQHIAAADQCELVVDDLTSLPQSAGQAVLRSLTDQLKFEPVHVTTGPLFGVRLVRLSDDEHVLIVAMEHMISDAVSVSIVLRDVLSAYLHKVNGEALTLPQMPVQFADFAVWQAQARESWVRRHGAYWDERLNGCGRLRFPQDSDLSDGNLLGWGTVSLKIGKDLKAELLEWCRLSRTTLVMAVFTAYVGLVLRWCNTSDTVIRYQTDGRASPKIQNTVGYFASILHLRVELRERDAFIDLRDRITQEYCQAHEHADYSYLDAQVPPLELTANTAFNWVPQEPKRELPRPRSSADVLTPSAAWLVRPVLRNYTKDAEPKVLFYDTPEEVVGGVHFPLNRFSRPLMERFGANFMAFLITMLRHPDECVSKIAIQ